jgi:hypothetical protein
MNQAAGMQNLAVLFRVHRLRRCDPFPMNGRAMNQSRRHRGCDHAQPYHGDFGIYFPFESSDVLAAASAAGIKRPVIVEIHSLRVFECNLN